VDFFLDPISPRAELAEVRYGILLLVSFSLFALFKIISRPSRCVEYHIRLAGTCWVSYKEGFYLLIRSEQAVCSLRLAFFSSEQHLTIRAIALRFSSFI
jgi:hypothetical protein